MRRNRVGIAQEFEAGRAFMGKAVASWCALSIPVITLYT